MNRGRSFCHEERPLVLQITALLYTVLCEVQKISHATRNQQFLRMIRND